MRLNQGVAGFSMYPRLRIIVVLALMLLSIWVNLPNYSRALSATRLSSSVSLPSPTAPYYGAPDDTRTTQTSASMPLMQNEPAIAINPLKASNMIVGYNDYSQLLGSCVRAHYSYTTNGGLTWVAGATSLPSTGITAAQCTQSQTPTGYTCCDPALAFDSLGNAYYATMTWDGKIVLYKSAPDGSGNAGASWTGPYIAANNPVGIDKPAIAIDRTGGAHNGNIYLAWVDYYNSGLNDRIYVRVATLVAGVPTFSGATVLASDPTSNYNWGPAITISQSGSLYVAYLRMPSNDNIPSSNTMMISRSDDGGATFALRGQVVDSALVSPFPASRFDAYGDRASAFPTITTTSNGTVFVAWTDGGAGKMNIQSRASVTNGATWESRVRVNDVATNDQFIPVAVTLASDTIDVFYYSRQGDMANTRGGLYTVYSLNGGASFSADTAYSSTFSNPNVCGLISGLSWAPCLWGDYIGAAVYGSGQSYGVCAVWADGRDSAMIGDNDVNTYVKCTHNNIFFAVGNYWWIIQRPPPAAYVPFNICILFPQLCIVRWQAEILPVHSTSGFMSVSLSANNLPTGVSVAFSNGAGYPPFNSTISVDFSKATCSDPTSCLQNINITATDGVNSTQIGTSEVLSKVPYLITDTNFYNPGDPVNLTGFQFTANSTATVKLDGNIVGNPSTDKAGEFSMLVNLPSSITNGAHTLTATDSKSLTANTTVSTPRIQMETDTGKKTVVPPSTGLSPLATLLLALTIGIITALPIRRRSKSRNAALRSDRGFA
jgi:hypothetical protein